MRSFSRRLFALALTVGALTAATVLAAAAAARTPRAGAKPAHGPRKHLPAGARVRRSR